MARKVNYLNNKDILKEIHKSKLTYCSFIDDTVKNYDMILLGVDKITKKVIQEARKARAERLAKEAQEVDLLNGIKKKLDEYLTATKDVPQTDVVFRVMTWEHIPIDEVKQKKADAKAQEEYDSEEDNFETEYDEPVVVKGATKYTKVNFPPFKHYRVDEAGAPVLVGISHWKGGIEKGKFTKDHGSMTPKLAHMFIKLCERYATRSNWRGYTYNDEMRSQALLQLSQIGLQFDEANIEKRNQNIRDDILEMNNYSPSYTRQGDWGAGGGHYEE